MGETTSRRTYTDAQRISTLAALELNAGNASKTARQTGIPRPTIVLWRDSAIAASPELSVSLTAPDTEKTDWAALYGEVQQEAIRFLRAQLPEMKGRDLAITVGILADKHLDYRDGRKSAAVVDQSQHLTLPPGTTLDDLKALREGLAS